MTDRYLPARRDEVPDGVPDPDRHPEFYAGVPLRRVLAFTVDLFLIACLMGVAAVVFFFLKVLSFGLLSPLLTLAFGLLPLAYHTCLIGSSRAATLGMQLLKLEVRTMPGGRPSYALAAIQTVAFYVTLGVTQGLVLLVPLFNKRRRCLHDYLCGTVVLNARHRHEPLQVEVVRP